MASRLKVFFNKCALCNSTLSGYELKLCNLSPVNLGWQNPKIPLTIIKCKYCGLVQLTETFVDRVNFPDEYNFRASRSETLKKHFSSVAKYIEQLIPSNSSILEIGANDGTLLRYLSSSFNNLHAVEPSNSVFDIDLNVKVSKGFFPIDTNFSNAQFDLIILTNTLAHLQNPREALNCAWSILKDFGYLFIEVVDFRKMQSRNEFDKFTHEHRVYFNKSTLKRILIECGFKIVYIKRIEIHGGSLQVLAKKSAQLDKVAPLRVSCFKEDFDLVFIQNTIKVISFKIMALIREEQRLNQKIYAVGGTTRGMTLMKSLGIATDVFHGVIDHDESNWLGKVLPNTNYRVFADKEIISQKGITLFILAWHISNEIIEKLRGKGFKGNVIIPLPTPRRIKIQ
jgi:hypothetical protein